MNRTQRRIHLGVWLILILAMALIAALALTSRAKVESARAAFSILESH
jgi:hypothetical protein